MIDPIQFKPYDPSTDNRPIDTTDVLPGFDRNTQRIVKDMQQFNQQERQNDRVRVDNAALYGKGLADLGKFSESLTNLMQTGAEAYIKSEEDAAAADALYGDIPISQSFEEEVQEVEAEGKAEDAALDKAEANGVSALTTQNYRNRSVWYQYARAKADIQMKAATIGSFLTLNQDTKIRIGDREIAMSDRDITAAEFAAVQRGLVQKFVQETGMGSYRPELIAKYASENIRTAVENSQLTWSQERVKQIKEDRLNDDATVVSGLKGNAQEFITQFGKGGQARDRAAAALGRAVDLDQMDASEALALLNEPIKTPAGTKSIAELFPAEFGTLKKQLEDKVRQDRRNAQSDQRLDNAEWLDQTRQQLNKLNEEGKYLSEDDQRELLKLARSKGIPDREILDIVQTSTEESQDRAGFLADKFIQNEERLPESIYDQLSSQKKEEVDKAGLSPESVAYAPPKKTVDAAKKYIEVSAAEKMQELEAEPQNRTPAYKRAVDRLTEKYKEIYAREMESGNTENADQVARAELDKIISDEDKLKAYQVPYSAESGQRIKERVSQLEYIQDDPSVIERKQVFNESELNEAKEAIESGTKLPAIFSVVARNYPKITARQLAEQQLGLAGITYNAPSKTLEFEVLEATPEDLRILLTDKPTIQRATRVSLGTQGVQPNDDQMLHPKVAAYKNGGVEKTGLDAIGRTESDSRGGYNAVNQGGNRGGRGIPQGAFSGPYRELSGRDLTSLSIGEIMDLQAKRPGMSNAEWYRQGRLHAVGRYQFIGDTFARVVKGMKLPPDTKFTPEIQDQMAIWLIRRDGWRGVWIGPTDHATYAERQALDKLARSRG